MLAAVRSHVDAWHLPHPHRPALHLPQAHRSSHLDRLAIRRARDVAIALLCAVLAAGLVGLHRPVTSSASPGPVGEQADG